MSTYQDLTAKQKSALESAALKVINARAEGRSMLMRAGIEPPHDARAPQRGVVHAKAGLLAQLHPSPVAKSFDQHRK